uniref:Carboxylic ester hydrolase n=1 Tax=Ditylenchus dipsaci TaxID=166011 RepID=A0A915DRJ8_9BILA
MVLSLLPFLLPVLIYAQQPFVRLYEYGAYGFPYAYQQDGQQFVSNVFLGLPYAKPAVGSLRLERPQALPINAQKIVNNTDLPNGCLQQEDITAVNPSLPTSEDCLFLNIITPSTTSHIDTKYPVLVYIHGVDLWAEPSEVMAGNSLHYRLGFWGFFSLGTQIRQAGNYGLWDQTAALRFVHKHIRSFGGDPNKVTVYGCSAGSVSTHALSLSPHSNIYFQQTIQASGSLYNPWTHSLKTIEQSKNISQQLGCYVPESVQQTKDCLKKLNNSQIWNVLKQYGSQRNSTDVFLWTPIMDQHFFVDQNISQLTERSPIRNTMYSSTKADGLISIFLVRTLDQQASFSKADFYNYIFTYLGNQEVAGPNYAKIQQLFLDYYTRGSNVSNLPSKFWYTRYVDAQTDGNFAGGQIVEMGYKLELNWTQHIYLFEYVHPSHRPLTGLDPDYTPHGYENQYIMDTQPLIAYHKNETNSVEMEFTRKIVDAMALFVKTGNPSTAKVPWPAIDDPIQIKYLQVGEQVVYKNVHYTEIAKLWKNVYRLGYAQPI